MGSFQQATAGVGTDRGQAVNIYSVAASFPLLVECKPMESHFVWQQADLLPRIGLGGSGEF
jgi:hypothetical protein